MMKAARSSVAVTLTVDCGRPYWVVWHADRVYKLPASATGCGVRYGAHLPEDHAVRGVARVHHPSGGLVLDVHLRLQSEIPQVSSALPRKVQTRAVCELTVRVCFDGWFGTGMKGALGVSYVAS